MEKFKYYFFREGIVTGLAGSQLGLNNTLTGFPESPPYGFWVDKSGNWITVEAAHVVNARNIIIKAYKYKKANNIEISQADNDLFMDKIDGFGYPYRELANHGFMHLVKAGSTYYYKAGSAGVTNGQRKFLSHIQDIYRMPTEVDNEVI
jgi:hypothetical protein